MRITMYELLGLIKDGKAPKKINFCGNIYEWEDDWYLTKEKNYKVCLGGKKEDRNILITAFNDDVEIMEEPKKIEKLDVVLLGQCDNWLRCPTNKVTKQDLELNPYIIDNIRENTLYFQRKINELIDTVNELKRDK